MRKIEKFIRVQRRRGAVQYLSARCDGCFDIGAPNHVCNKENLTCITDLIYIMIV